MGRSVSLDMQRREAAELEAQDRDLQDKVQWANLNHMKAKVEQDIKVLKEQCKPCKDREARETALDMQYLQSRQQTLSAHNLKNMFLC